MPRAFESLLLATERTEFDVGAERVALALAQRGRHALGVVMPLLSNAEFEAVAPQLAERADREAAARLQPLRDQAQAAGVAIDLRVRRGAEAWREIVDDAQQRGADLLIVRKRGRRGLLARLLVGEMVGQVVAHAPCSVLVVPPDAQPWTRQVLLFAEPGAAGAAPLQRALALAAERTLPLQLLCSTGDGAAAQRSAEHFVGEALRRAGDAGVAANAEVLVDASAAQILQAAQRLGADLLVLQRGGLAHEVTGQATCAVLLIPEPSPQGDASS